MTIASIEGAVVAQQAWFATIAWLYLATNAARVLTYIPQIVVVWRCRDGARSISLVTWASWVVANLTAVAYGALIVEDLFFTAVSLLNFACCGAVTLIAAHRRGLWRRVRPR